MAINTFPTPSAGIPSGNTAGRPASPSIGDQYYNGETLTLEIFDGTDWYPISSSPGQYTIVATDVGTNVAFGAAQASIAFTSTYTTGEPLGYVTYATSGGYTSTGTSSPMIAIVGNNGNWAFNGLAYNDYGQGPLSNTTTSIALTTLPEAPTIGTATSSSVTSDVVVTWTLGNSGGKNLSSITITPYLNGTTAQTSQTAATTSSTTHTFTGLTQGSSYTFKVKAANANGTSLESSATNSVSIPNFITVNYLVIAGGGGGGGRIGGGGGAGGFRSSVTATGGGGSLESAASPAKSTNFTVTVGAGGAGGVGSSTAAVKGSNSVFSTITSEGGGRGSGGTGNANQGGSGGGAGFDSGIGSGTTNQGYGGGARAGGEGSGGGGGANAVGGSASSKAGAAGGAGVATSITGSSVTRGGGGGGGARDDAGALDSFAGGAGGTGGGGAGGASGRTGTAGTVNTGGGGGGRGYTDAQGSGGDGSAGGSGVVILRWLTADGSITVGAGLTADATGTDGSHSYKRFTAGTGNVSFS